MNRRVLFVDDEQRVLDALRRPLRQAFDITTSANPAAAVQLLDEAPPFAVVVSDMRMPEMSGVDFLSEVRKRCPDTTRVMLTGNQDQATAAAAVNDGAVFRFLNKPCDITKLTTVLEEAVRHHQILSAEKEILTQTLQGSIRVLVEALSIAKPELFGSADRLERNCSAVASGVEGLELWEMKAAARLAYIGCVGMSDGGIQKLLAGEPVTPQEKTEFEQHPEVGSKLIKDIPRLAQVAQIIRYQSKNFDGSGYPKDGVAGLGIPAGARILRIVQAYDALQSKGQTDVDALMTLRGQTNVFDAELLDKFVHYRGTQMPAVFHVTSSTLRQGYTIAEDVLTKRGVLIVCRGQLVTAAITRHMENFALLNLLPEKILVYAH